MLAFRLFPSEIFDLFFLMAINRPQTVDQDTKE